MKERVSRIAEGVEIIKRLWTEDKVTHMGRHWQLDNVTIRPRPAQRPRPPIMIAAQVESANPAGGAHRRRLVHRADAAHRCGAAKTWRRSHGACRSRPTTEPRISRASMKWRAPATRRRPCARAAPFLLAKYAAYASWGLPGLTLDKGASPIEQMRGLAKDRFGAGTPAQVADALMASTRPASRTSPCA